MADFKETMWAEIQRRKSELQNLEEAYRRLYDGEEPGRAPLNLNDLPITDAIRQMLEHAWENGRQELTLGEIEDTLGRFQVLTSRSGKPFNEVKHQRRQLTIVLGRNRRVFHVERKGEQITRNDFIRLAKPPSRKAKQI
jgi:hypothetical protein